MEEQSYAGCCGLYCGLCPRFQSSAASRCLGCQLGPQHSYCSVWRCCVGKRGFLSCAECGEYPCERLRRVLGVEQGADSFISHKPALPNLERIREAGLATYLEEQRQRRLVLEELVAGFNEGRSMSFFCAASALMPPHLLQRALEQAKGLLEDGQLDGSDRKARAKAMRRLIEEHAAEGGVDLRLRRG